ncbi:MAG TPA: exodeoxyribonuclease VII small subunit [Dehalococcoidia bacterium]|jgi:exodeoxyribonuclease VII small subunit|nr:exodeoxyribonuclease VII small subunit [Dehalococcoidia bacterium]
MPREKSETFEQIYQRLEETVAKLEHGGLSLEESIALYEEGMTLARRCQERLDDAELKITKLRESFAALPRVENAPAAMAEEDEPPIDDYEYVPPED